MSEQTNSDHVDKPLAEPDTSTHTATQFPATKVVHWPSGPTAACDVHASALVGLSIFLGHHVGVTAAPDGSECGNCRNEATK